METDIKQQKADNEETIQGLLLLLFCVCIFFFFFFFFFKCDS